MSKQGLELFGARGKRIRADVVKLIAAAVFAALWRPLPRQRQRHVAAS